MCFDFNSMVMEDPMEEEMTLCEEIGYPYLDSLEHDDSSVGEAEFHDPKETIRRTWSTLGLR